MASIAFNSFGWLFGVAICALLLAPVNCSIIRSASTATDVLGGESAEVFTCEEDSEVAHEETTLDDSSCLDCADQKAALSPKQMQEMRLAFVKDQILQKLQMARPPCPRFPKPNLTPLVMATDNMKNDTEDEDRRDELNGKIESLVLFQSNDAYDCREETRLPCLQMQYSLPKDVKRESLKSIEVWVYKANKESILEVKEIILNESGDRIEKRAIAHRNDDISSSWMKYEMPSLRSWISEGFNLTFTVRVICKYRCGVGYMWPIEVNGEKKPFAIAQIRNYKVTPRSRRSVDCVEGSTTCCRESFYLSFAEIGWDDWILQPEGYNANFCRGRCINDISITRYHHSTVLHSFMQTHSTEALDMGLKMCCTPSQMSPMSFLYRDEEGNIFHKSLPNMVVETCDCA